MITLTDTAATKVKDLIEAEGEPNLALRVAVRPGGCSGFSYEMFFDTDVADDDNLDRLRRACGSSSTPRAPSCSRAPRSTTRTASRAPGSPSTTRTPSAPAAAASPSADRPLRPQPRRRPRLHGQHRRGRRRRHDVLGALHRAAGEHHGRRRRAPRRAPIAVGLHRRLVEARTTAIPRPTAPSARSSSDGHRAHARRSSCATSSASWCCGSKRRTTASTSSTGSSPARSRHARSATRTSSIGSVALRAQEQQLVVAGRGGPARAEGLVGGRRHLLEEAGGLAGVLRPRRPTPARPNATAAGPAARPTVGATVDGRRHGRRRLGTRRPPRRAPARPRPRRRAAAPRPRPRPRGRAITVGGPLAHGRWGARRCRCRWPPAARRPPRRPGRRSARRCARPSATRSASAPRIAERVGVERRAGWTGRRGGRRLRAVVVQSRAAELVGELLGPHERARVDVDVQPRLVVRRLRREVHGAERYRCAQASSASASTTSAVVEDRVEAVDDLAVGADEHEAGSKVSPSSSTTGAFVSVSSCGWAYTSAWRNRTSGWSAVTAEEHVEHRTADGDLAERRRRHEQRERPAVVERVGDGDVVERAHRVVRCRSGRRPGRRRWWAWRWPAGRRPAGSRCTSSAASTWIAISSASPSTSVRPV